MTRKEKAFDELFNVAMEYFNNEQQANYEVIRCRRCSIERINQVIEMFKTQIKHKKIEESTAAFYATPEGQQFKEDLNIQIESLIAKAKELELEYIEKLNEEFKTLIPELIYFQVTHLDINHIIFENPNSLRNTQIDFFVRRKYEYDNQSEKFDYTLGVYSMGGIDISKSNDESKYYQTVGLMFGNGETIKTIFDKFFYEYNDKLKQLNIEHNELIKKRNNPLDI